MNRTLHFDLIVIGAGPSGSAAACWAARSGLKVALIDKHPFPRDKLCGGAFTERAMGLYRQIFAQNDLGAPYVARDAVEFYAFGSPLGQLHSPAPLRLTMRRSLDAHLFELAINAGAQDFTGSRITGLSTDPVRVNLGHSVLTAPVLIGADGVNSFVARHLFGKAFEPDQIGFALEVEAVGLSPDLPLRIDFGAANWGYGWQFPKADSTTIGIGGIHARNPDMRRDMLHYLKTLGIADAPKVKGQYLPFGFARTKPGKAHVLLAGDAAGLVDPITGEGIAFALQSGKMAADAAQTALHEGRPEAALSIYRAQLRPLHLAMWQARQLRHLLFNPTLRRPFLNGFQRSSTMKNAYMQLLSGKTEYSEISRKILTKMPRLLMRAATPIGAPKF